MEYVAELKHENEKASERESLIKTIRSMVLSMLGLNLKEAYDAFKEGREPDPDKYIPLVLLAGNHHMMEPYLKEISSDMHGDDATGQSKVDDESYEEQAKRLMAGDADPIDWDPLAGKSPQDIINEVQAKSLGVQRVDEFPPPHGGVIIEDG